MLCISVAVFPRPKSNFAVNCDSV